MTFSTAIQTYDGAHATHDTGSLNTATDWQNGRVWFQGPFDSAYITRYGITSGIEQAWTAKGSGGLSGLAAATGWDSDGNIYASGPNSFTAGSLTKIDGTALTFIANTVYPAHFGGANILALKVGGTQYILDQDVGGSIGGLANTQLTAGTTFSASYGWSAADGAHMCMGKVGTPYGYLFSASGSETCTLSQLNLPLGTASVLKTYVPTDFGSTWTGIYIYGMCLDQTDGNPIIYVGDGDSTGVGTFLAKLNNTTGAIIWMTNAPWCRGGPGYQFSQSRILYQRLALLSDTPRQITVYNTSDGSIVGTPQTTGIAGITVPTKQAFDDTSGAIMCFLDWDGTGPSGGGPSSLNGSTGPFTGWAAIYVTTGGSGASHSRRSQGLLGPIAA